MKMIGMTISYAILIVIFPCFLTYFLSDRHDVPKKSDDLF